MIIEVTEKEAKKIYAQRYYKRSTWKFYAQLVFFVAGLLGLYIFGVTENITLGLVTCGLVFFWGAWSTIEEWKANKYAKALMETEQV